MSTRHFTSRTPMMLLVIGSAFALPVFPQLLRNPIPELLDGRIGPDQIVEDSSKEPAQGQKWSAFGDGLQRTECLPTLSTAEMRKRAEERADEAAKADPRALVNFSSRSNLATTAGAKVKRIVVHHWSPHGWGKYPTWSDVSKEIQTVWAGRIEALYSASNGIGGWSERSLWNVFASIPV